MIQSIVNSFEANKPSIRSAIEATTAPSRHITAAQLVRILTEHLEVGAETKFDPERTTIINHGDYQGTEVFILTTVGYQPDDYFATSYGYGSCSGCDVLEDITSQMPWVDEPDQDEFDRCVDLLMTECLHLVQGMRQISGASRG